MINIPQLLLLYSPTIISGIFLLFGLHREPRQFRNAIWLLLFLVFLSGTLVLQFGLRWLILPIVVLVILTPILVVAFLLVNTVIVTRREGVSLTTLLPALLALAVALYLLLSPPPAHPRCPPLVSGSCGTRQPGGHLVLLLLRGPPALLLALPGTPPQTAV